MNDIAVISLITVPLATALAVLVLDLKKQAGWLTVAASVFIAAVVLLMGREVVTDGPQSAYHDWFYVDELGVIVLALIALVGVCAALNSLGYIEHEVAEHDLTGDEDAPRGIAREDTTRYYALFLGFMATMVAVPVVNNLGLMWVAIEATTVVSVLLVSINRTGQSLEAAWKYLVIGSVGIAMALFGTMMTYYAASSFLGESSVALNWTSLRTAGAQLDPEVMRVAFVFIVIGYGTKVGLAPMHTWLPDAHSQAPSPVSGLLSGVLLNCALYAILRFSILTSEATGSAYTDHILIAFGLFSIVLAVPFLVVQHDIKRLLGYHSVEHMGIIVLAIGVGGSTALYAAMLHMVAHSLTKSSLFFAAGGVVQAFNSRSMHRMRGLLRIMPVAGVALVLGAFALAGLPPFAMFTSEYGLMSGAFSTGQGAIGVAGIFFVALAAASLLYHVVGVAYSEPRSGSTARAASPAFAVSVIAPLAVLVWISIAPPDRFEDTLRAAVVILEGS